MKQKIFNLSTLFSLGQCHWNYCMILLTKNKLYIITSNLYWGWTTAYFYSDYNSNSIDYHTNPRITVIGIPTTYYIIKVENLAFIIVNY